MRITSGGNVGIGATNPLRKLHVAGNFCVNNATTEYYGILMQGGEGDNPSILIGDWHNSSGTIKWDSTGNYLRIDSQQSAANGAILFSGNDGSTEYMRITSGGVFLVNQTVPNTTGDGFGVHPTGSGGGNLVSCHNGTAGAALIVGHGAFDGTIVDFRRASTQVGTISVTSSATAYNTSSDYRLKENVVPMEGALDRVDALKPFRFNFIADADKTVDGFLAHEVQDIVPEAITGEKDAVDEKGNPEYQGIDQSKLVPLLVAAIQELKAEIELLKSK